jgi:pantothenate synthetase
LSTGRLAHASGGDPVAAASAVLATEPGLDVDYVETAGFNGRVHLLAAVRAGRTRLIDNVILEGSL